MHVAEICHWWLQIETFRGKVGAGFGVSWFSGVAQKYHQTKDHSQNGLGADPSPQWFFNPDPSSECIQED